MARGLFVGICALDSVFRVEGRPEPNRKQFVEQWGLFAGGPATNAAVAFAALGGEVTLGTALGSHPLADVIRQDLAAHSVAVRDYAPEHEDPPAFATVAVSSPGGDRQVLATGAEHLPLPADIGSVFEDLRPDVVLLDGHLLPLARDAAAKAREAGVPVVLDSGSWKPRIVELLPYVDVAICPDDFAPPNVSGDEAVFDFLQRAGVHAMAVTHGSAPIAYRTADTSGEIAVDPVEAVDTLGAGDIFHGAFAYEWASGNRDFPGALAAASEVAGFACRFFGTRAWIAHR